MSVKYCAIYSLDNNFKIFGEFNDKKYKTLVNEYKKNILEGGVSGNYSISESKDIKLTYLKTNYNKLIICISDASIIKIKSLISKILSKINTYEKQILNNSEETKRKNTILMSSDILNIENKCNLKSSNNKIKLNNNNNNLFCIDEYKVYSNMIDNEVKNTFDSENHITVNNINNDINSIKTSTKKSIQSIISKQENLNELLIKSNQININSVKYKKNAKYLKRSSFCNLAVLYIVIIVFIFVLIWCGVSVVMCHNLLYPICTR